MHKGEDLDCKVLSSSIVYGAKRSFSILWYHSMEFRI